jgi:hypothetical protein
MTTIIDLDRAVNVLRENTDLVFSVRETDNVLRSRIHSHFKACGIPTFSIVDRTWHGRCPPNEIGKLKGVEHTCITCDTVTYTATEDMRPHSHITDDPYDDDYMLIMCSRPGCPGCMGDDDDGLIELYYFENYDTEDSTFRRVFDNNTVLVGQIFSRYPVERHNRRKSKVVCPDLKLKREDTKWFVPPQRVMTRREWENVMPLIRSFQLLGNDDKVWAVVCANIRHNNKSGVLSHNGYLAIPSYALQLIGAFL